MITPGPWTVSRNEHDERIIVSERPQFNVVVAHLPTGNEIEANAHLIAAAPALLVALSEVAEHARHYGGVPQSAVKLWTRVNAVLAAAEGREP